MSLDLQRPHIPGTRQPVRYAWIMAPGSDLVTSHDPFVAMVYADQFAHETALEPTSEQYRYEVIVTPLSPLPMPASYPNEQGERSRFTGLNPSATRNPMFWLPEELRSPYVYSDANGEAQIEESEEWQARVALELTASGLYSPEDGWVDVLATYLGLDVADAAVQQRITDYLAGAPDEELDSLHDHVEAAIAASPQAQENPMWAVSESMEATAIAERNTYVFAAVLRAHIRDRGAALAEDGQLPADELARAVTDAAAAMLAALQDMLPLSDGSEMRIADYLDRLRVEAEAGGDPEQILANADAALARIEAVGMEKFPDEPDSETI